jgi:hypothetical protein
VQQSEIKLFIGGHNADVPLIKNTDVSYKKYLFKAGFTFCTDINKADAAVFIEMDGTELAKLKHEIPIILIRNEPIVVWPTNYESKLTQRVHKTIDVGQYSIQEGTFTPWPQDWTQILPEENPISSRIEKVALINGNKIGFIPGELYSLRRRCIFKVNTLDLYGAGWDLTLSRKFLIMAAEIVISLRNRFIPNIRSARFWFSRPSNFCGTPDSKYSVLRKYKYALVIENSKNYMSEKLFDALFARNIPIYVGPNVELFGIPTELVVQVNPDFASVTSGLDFAQKIDYEKWASDVEIWLADPATKQVWNSENVYKRIVQDIIQFLEVNLKNNS